MWQYDKILVVVSHSQDFLNTVCTKMMHLNKHGKMDYYGGNYDSYVQTRAENETNQMRAYNKVTIHSLLTELVLPAVHELSTADYTSTCRGYQL